MNMDEIVLFDARKYKRSPGFVKVSCLIQNELDDPDLKEEIVKLLLDTPYPDRAVGMLVKVLHATKESACRVCIEIAKDLHDGCADIRPPEQDEEDKKQARPNIGDPGSALALIREELKKEERKPSRHAGVANKTYVYERLCYYYTDPTKLKDTEIVRIVS